MASSFLRFCDSLNFKKDMEFVGITVLFLDEKVLSMYKRTDHPFLIRFISLTIIDEVITGAPETNLQSIRLFDNLQVIANTNLELSCLVRILAKRYACGAARPSDLLKKRKKSGNSVIHGFTPVGRANHYMPSLKAGSTVKVDRFEVARCSSMYKITDHPFLILFISLTIIDEVITGAPETNLQSIRLFDNLQGSDLTKETARVVIRLLIDP
ncbi:hypothetical protein F2Q69_00049754 [Brassica cretica]|uniref:Uncharacterized protein n=1 Tax=Brassica cretica TaxID=69181 RepID=A0A8S9PT57_BRACR|nr:hypothetical protein F2Q69_00049754 [Brassica cretica]